MPHNGRLSTPGSFRKKVIRANLISTPTSPACDASSLKHRSMVAVSAFSGGCVLASEALGHYGSSALSLTSTKREEKFPWWLMNESTRVVEEQTGGTNAAHQEDSMQTPPSSLIPTCPWPPAMWYHGKRDSSGGQHTNIIIIPHPIPEWYHGRRGFCLILQGSQGLQVESAWHSLNELIPWGCYF